ncbi:UDP-Glycosyltransferase superfamily protein, putative [Theobroma cacao]|uniref:Glycosyltransferase n=1 Tax=Theobroma cacao TaxID=3641 RepID=A0A061F0H0_THECC|nr:UDP-Glycosyltransferase superfamily protein, putative [Theobroma cacao]
MNMESCEPHFLFVPLMCPGHIIPLMDIARLLGERNVAVTMVITPLNATRFGSVIERALKSGLPINFLQLQFPSTEVGLPKGCESIDRLPSLDLVGKFLTAQSMLQEPLEEALQGMKPFPSCIVTDKNIPWIATTASKFQIPRILFDGTSSFTHICSHNLHKSMVYEHFSDSEPFVIPGLPHRIEFTKAQLPSSFNPGSNKDLMAFRQTVKASEAGAFGVLLNTFEELETEYVKAYREATGFKVWCIGPVSLCNREILDKAERGRIPAIDENQCMKWLDFQAAGSVIYVCFGTLNRIPSLQLIEIAIALEASNRPFIWVLREGYKREEMETWLDEVGYEERIKGRGLLIRGWASQVLILSHQAIGGFLTHCGWNSTLEGICAGVPMITWPLFAEQFYNEKLIVQVLDIGVGVGTQQVVMHFGENDKSGALVKAEDIKKAIDKLMDAGEEGEQRRKKAAELAATAEKAVAQGGSSYLNITLLIEDVMQKPKFNQTKF